MRPISRETRSVPHPGLCSQASWNQASNASCKVLLAGMKPEGSSGWRGFRPTAFINTIPSMAVASCSGSAALWPGLLPELLGFSRPPATMLQHPPTTPTSQYPPPLHLPSLPRRDSWSTPVLRTQCRTHQWPHGSTGLDRSCSQPYCLQPSWPRTLLHTCADETSLPVLGAGLLWKGPPPCPLFEGLQCLLQVCALVCVCLCVFTPAEEAGNPWAPLDPGLTFQVPECTKGTSYGLGERVDSCKGGV